MSAAVSADAEVLLANLQAEAELLVHSARDVVPHLHVGAAGRTTAETLRHVGDACEDALSWLGADEGVVRRWSAADVDSVAGLTARLSARLAELLAELGSRPTEDVCPTWWPEDRRVHFWLRRMAHVVALHRVDVQAAAGGEVAALSPDLALDGVDEAVRLWFGYRLRALGVTAQQPWRVRVRAGDYAWLVHADPECSGELDEKRRVPVDGVIAGEPVELYLWLWGRVPDRVLHVVGDRDVIAELWGLLRLATR